MTRGDEMPKAKSQARDKLLVIAIRLPESLVKRVDAHAERLGQQVSGVNFTRGDAMKALLTDALNRAEVEK